MTACTYVEQIRPAHSTAKTTIEATTCSNRPIIDGCSLFHLMQYLYGDSSMSGKGRIAFSPSVFRDSRSLRYCPVSMYLTVIALNLADFGLVVVSQRICRFQFICGATIVGC